MTKKYSFNKPVLLAVLALLFFNLSVLAQSKSGKGAAAIRASKRITATNVARNGSLTPNLLSTTTVTACDSYTWPENGQTYTTTGIFTSGGGITQLFNDQTAWDTSATTSGATVSTNNLAGIPAATTITVTLGTISATFSAPSGMYTSGTFIGTNNPNEPITVAFSPSIYGIAANIFDTNISDTVISGNVTATYSDGAIDSRTVTANTETFGYFSTTPLTSLVLTSTTASPGRFISLNNLSIATNPTSPSTLDLTIIPAVTPTFPAVTPICAGNTLTALPTTSANGITGTWSPALDNTTTTAYTFTPDAGQCATTANTTITVFPVVSNSTDVTACSSYIWPINGVTYTNSGSYTTTIPITDSSVIDDVTLWNQHAQHYNATIDFNDLSNINVTNPTNITMGAVNVTMSAPGGMYSNGNFVGTANPNNPITIAFNPPVYGVSGNYFTTDIGDNTISGNITVTYSNGTIQTRTVTTDTDSFGYFDANSISSIVISTSTTVPNRYVTVKNLSIASNPTSCSTETLNLTINSTPPPGASFATAIEVSDPNYTTTGNNLAVNCYTDTIGTAAPDVWYKVNLDACAQTISLNTCTGTNFDTILRVFDQDGTTELTNSDDDCGFTLQSSISDFDVSALDVVYVLVEGYYGLGHEQGTYGLNITQTLLAQTTPTFTPIAPICNGDTVTLPTTSTNGYTGTWSPALNNTATTTYTFTPDAGQCATTTTLTITVNQPITPNFTAVAAICNGDALTALPTTSNNGYTGSWSPALNNTATTTYTFTPDAGQCANTATLTITVNQPVTPAFNAVTPTCNGASLTALPTTSNNGYTGTWSPALDNTATTSYTFTPDAGQCANTASLTITVNQPVTPTFTPIGTICNGDAVSLPTTSNNGYTGSWSPALNNTTTTTYTFTPTAGQCANTATLTISVNQHVTPTFTAVAPICNGDTLTALPTTSNNGYTGSWSPALNNTATTTYTFTPTGGQCANTATLTITVNQPVTPTFTPIGTICNGDALTALPTTSDNGYTGTWSPALNNTATTTYTFTPDAGQCANTATLTITVNQPVTPAFNAVTPICNGASLTALPTTSNNGYTGTWSPALDNTATTTYTFTPTAGQCANTASLTISVNQPVTPTFTPIGTICNGDAVSLPTTSNNSYTGTWSPTLNNTATTTYTFTPAAGQCANTASFTITVNQKVTPTFTSVAPICNGDTLTALPTTSNNGYTGTWSPALNNTATTTYTFTPDAGQCANTATLTITVNQPVTPTFTAVTPICNGGTLSALPTTSNNGYTGTWSPALDNTVTTTYTFTPDAGQCAATNTLTITVNQPVTPTFTPVGSICSGGSLSALPTTSNNGYTGTWSPALDNTATTTYSFTPTAGQCAATTSLTITVNQPFTVPTFSTIAPICNGDVLTLPTLSNNGVLGTWSPTSNNTTTTTYTFTPNVGQCAVTVTLTVIVNQPVTPTFTGVNPICNGDTLATLPTTSNNGYSGTWSPALNNTATTTYTFTPSAGQCANPTGLTIIVNQPVTPTFTAVSPICNGDTLAALPTTSNNGYIGTWSPAVDNTVTTTYTFTPSAGQCVATASLAITVNQPVMPTFTAVSPICTGGSLSALPTTSNNGYTGTWSPALDNTTTTTYTFTPTSGQCANTASSTIIVNQPVTPSFTAVAPICNGDPLLALPTTSTNGYSGSWSPALDNTTTSTYSFTPDAGQCSTTTTMTIVVNSATTPSGNAVQTFSVAALTDATIANIVVSPTNVIWYGSLADAQTATNALSSSTVLTTGATYYAVNVVGACASSPLAVTVSVTLGRNEFDDLHFNYYPNPTATVLTISYSKNITQVSVVDLIGQVIMTKKTNAMEVQIDLSRLATATYFVKVTSEDKEKIIKVIKSE